MHIQHPHHVYCITILKLVHRNTTRELLSDHITVNVIIKIYLCRADSTHTMQDFNNSNGNVDFQYLTRIYVHILHI